MTLFDQAQRFVGEVRELPGGQHDPFVQWCFTKCGYGPETPDEVPWCSAFLNGICWLERLPRSKSARARSWLTVGQSVALADAQVGYDVVILKRGTNAAGPDVIDAPGHVGLFAGREPALQVSSNRVLVLGGNQSDAVTVASFSADRILGIRRLSP